SRRHRELGPVGLAVLERHLRGHARCPACAHVYPSLRAWQRHALINEAQRLADWIGLTGSRAKWIGTVLAVTRQPRLLRACFAELAAAVARQPRLIGARLAKLAAGWRSR